MAVPRLGADTGLESSSADNVTGRIAHFTVKNGAKALASQNKNKMTALLVQTQQLEGICSC